MEPFYPLHVYVCGVCFLVQLEEYVDPREIFTEYAYFSSYSNEWLTHAARYVDMVIHRFDLTKKSKIVEVASNDGYLLQYFVQKGFAVLGIEPAANIAKIASEKGVPTIVKFLDLKLANELARDGNQADLLIGNNVLAQVPNLNDFVEGLKVLLGFTGVITLEFPHLLNLINKNQFDTIYHEHFSYFSLSSAEQLLARHGLRIFDIEELPTHGGSLRVFACHAEDDSKSIFPTVVNLKEREREAGLNNLQEYSKFEEKVKETKRKLLELLINLKRNHKSIAGYGAPGKGNTLLNYCGIRTDFLDYTVDRNPYKQGKFLPGTHIPIFDPLNIEETKPDYLLILPWNLKDEIMQQMTFISRWGGKFILPIPEAKVYDAKGFEVKIDLSNSGRKQ
jgi:hypothetical protein